jgi:UDP-N-acetylmuramoyl-L-alanyl-D-glutamate--2,6-diaminopimelate ligase
VKLRDLLEGIDFSSSADLDRDITAVVSDSRKISDGCVFVCIEGKRFDGHSAAAAVLENGAGVVVTQRRLGLKNEVTVADTRAAYALMCHNFFGNPQRRLCLIAVTGTNGKTTVSTIIKQALISMGVNTGLIGTIQCEIGEMVIPAKFTTPEPWGLSALLARMADAGCTHAVMEASSQAIDQGRLIGLEFSCAVFTNLTQDHLDYHGTMENYYLAKRSLFDQALSAVVNIDDERGRELAAGLPIPTLTVSADNDSADYTAKSVDYSISGVRFAVNGTRFIERVAFPMPGRYSVNNAMCAIGALFAVGIEKHAACAAVSSTRGVRGRCEVLYNGDFTVICDYAHTPDGLEQLLSSLKPFVDGRLIVLFGCGGDRDPYKRPKMAATVCRYADFIVLTSDNPRTEDPMAIIDQISPSRRESGVDFTCEPDRSAAIALAVQNTSPGDVLVLCGKGHEDYQVLDGCTIYLDESRVVGDIIKRLSNR